METLTRELEAMKKQLSQLEMRQKETTFRIQSLKARIYQVNGKRLTLYNREGLWM